MAKKAAAVKKGAPFSKAGRFLREVGFELKKVHWPTRRQLLIYTSVVLVAVAIMGVLTWLVDSFLMWAMAFILR
ncbi:MAG: preprotein translocase subunit SecE [Peptococcaceae bacterium]|nr:preprotein translocase subunit SecE [Peptococcaceae bacterium]MDR2737046.1 preprotein translocase subunit SecE [Gracilibacteraceae bacterium]